MNCELCGQPITDAANSRVVRLGCCSMVYVHQKCPPKPGEGEQANENEGA